MQHLFKMIAKQGDDNLLHGNRRALRPECLTLEDRRLLSVTLSSGARPAAALVGSPIVWTAEASGHGETPVYQFRVTPVGGESEVVCDYGPSKTMTWAPPSEGRYVVSVAVKSGHDAAAAEAEFASVVQNVRPRVGRAGAAINRTANPLVALYSIAPGPATSYYIQYKPQGSAEPWSETTPQATIPGKTTNVLVAGLRPDTTYVMRHVRADGASSVPRTFRTGALPTNLTFPTFNVLQPPAADTDPAIDTVFHIGVNPPQGTVNTLATDLAGNIVWYYNPVADAFPSQAPRLTSEGTVLLLGRNEDGVGGASSLREIDLAGNTLHETNASAVNAQLAARGLAPIINLHHEALRLPDGRTAVLARTEKYIDVNGKNTRYEGDALLVLDSNFQVVWTWYPFEWLDTNVLSPINDGPGDWMHSNSISWSPADGNLTISMRSLDWVIKINYDHGQGDGSLPCKLGRNGDFQIESDDPYPWFTHQHDAHYVNDSMMMVYDNGNTRVIQEEPNGSSRGQLYHLDEQNMRATLVVNADLGEYAPAVGSAQRLSDGTFSFNSGFTQKTINVRADGTPTFIQKMNMKGFQYRSYMFSDLYGDTTDLYDPGFEDPPLGTGEAAQQLNPTGSAWIFNGPAGVAGNGSAIKAGQPDAPQGSQVAFLREGGSIRQELTFRDAGAYRVRLSAAQGEDTGITTGMIVVQVDGKSVGTISPTTGEYTSYTTASFHVGAGNHTVSFLATDPTGDDFLALLDRVAIENVAAADASGVVVDLSGAYNRTGIVSDGTTATGGGLDGHGNAFSSQLLGTRVAAGGTGFVLGAANAPNVVSANRQMIALPGGQHRALRLLATAVNGAQSDQPFVVTYTDGTSTVFRQTLSDWTAPGRVARQAVAANTDYRNTAVGERHAGPFRAYVYTLPLNPAKSVRSLTLPSNVHVEILAATLVPMGRSGRR